MGANRRPINCPQTEEDQSPSTANWFSHNVDSIRLTGSGYAARLQRDPHPSNVTAQRDFDQEAQVTASRPSLQREMQIFSRSPSLSNMDHKANKIRGNLVNDKVLAISFMLASLLLYASACGDTPTKVTDAIDSALLGIHADSANWRIQVEQLQNTLKGMSGDAATLARTEVDATLKRAIAASGVEFRCNADFLADRVTESLQALKSRILGTTLLETPTFCSTSPASVDMMLSPERRNRIEVTGYNFDVKPSIRARLVTSNSVLDVSQNLSLQHQYEMTLNLGGSTPEEGLQLDATSRRIELTWNDKVISTIPVIQRPPTPPCTRTDVISQPFSYTYLPPYTGAGDRDLFGNGDIRVEVRRETTDSTVDARIYMKARQYNDDHSAAEGTSEPIRLFTAPGDKKIADVAAPVSDPPVTYRDTTWEIDNFGGGGGLVDYYEISGDHNGDELGTWTKVKVQFNALHIQLTPRTGCI